MCEIHEGKEPKGKKLAASWADHNSEQFIFDWTPTKYS